MLWFMVVILFVLGLVVGSFLNVVIYRTIQGEDWVKGRSRCDYCKQVIAWYDNIPLVSYVLLGGKCRYCHKKIATQHFTIELLTGTLFVWWYVIGFTFFKLVETPLSVVQPLFWLVVGILLLIIFATDWLYQIIPDYANVGLLVLALGYRFYLSINQAMQWRDFGLSVMMGLSLAVFLGLLWFLTKGRGMGFGDVKFALVMGILLGWPRGLVALLLAFWIGALVGLVMIVTKVKKLKERIAFGPFLVLGTALSLLWGNYLWQIYLSLIGS